MVFDRFKVIIGRLAKMSMFVSLILPKRSYQSTFLVLGTTR